MILVLLSLLTTCGEPSSSLPVLGLFVVSCCFEGKSSPYSRKVFVRTSARYLEEYIGVILSTEQYTYIMMVCASRSSSVRIVFERIAQIHGLHKRKAPTNNHQNSQNVLSRLNISRFLFATTNKIMPPPRKQSTVDVVVKIFDGVRNERISMLQPVRAQQQQIRQWLSSRISVRILHHFPSG